MEILTDNWLMICWKLLPVKDGVIARIGTTVGYWINEVPRG